MSEVAAPVAPSRPRVSIGLPVYNGERFIRATLESLQQQTWRDLEIIVGDNCSTDGTGEIVRSFMAGDARVRYIRHERNLGIAGNYMRLVEAARGELFRWAAADDLCGPRAVELCVAALDQHPDAVLAYPKTKLIDEEGNFLQDYEDNVDLRGTRPSERFIQLLERLGLCNAVFGLMRREVLCRTRGLRPFVGSDIPLLAELALYGQFIEVPEREFHRRFHPAASSALQGSSLQHLFTPGRDKRGTPNWDRLKALVAAVLHSPIPPGEKWRAGAYILQTIRAQRGYLAEELSAGLISAGTAPRARS